MAKISTARRVLLPVLLLPLLGSLALAGDTNARLQAQTARAQKQKDIRRLMTLTGSADLGKQMMANLLNALKPAHPDVPESFWKEFLKEANATDLIDQCVPVYDRHLSHADIKELIRFYETPTGRRLIKATPAITQESMVLGQKWGQEAAQKVLKRLREKGYTRAN
jgi:uncharacterized protein